MAVESPQRIRSDIVRLSHRGLGVHDFSLAAARALRRRVPFDGVCVLTLDPATLLPTGEVVEHGLPPAATERLTEIEVGEPDFNKFTDLARAARPAASLSEATERRLDRSRRHRELKRPNGFADELRATFVGNAGAWGAITLLRGEGRPDFAAGDARLLASLAPLFAEGLRRAILLSAVSADVANDSDAGLLILDGDSSIVSANPAGRMWLAELGGGNESEERLPLVVHAVAGRARSATSGTSDREVPARARVRTAAGRWLLVRGSILDEGSRGATAVMIEPAGTPELAPLIADAYGLTERERLVTQLVAQGRSTDEIASKLHLSPYTVQDHLKAIFEKAGVSSRGELVARLFFEHYAPRLTSEAPVGPNGWFA